MFIIMVLVFFVVVFCFRAVTCMHPTVTERFREIINLHESGIWLITGS